MNFRDLLAELEKTGFFNAVPKNNQPAVKEEILKTKYLFPDEINRSFFADAENLAEQGVLEFIAEISPTLAKHGVYIPVIEIKQAPRKIRDPETGEIREIIPTRLRVDDSIPDETGIAYLR